MADNLTDKIKKFFTKKIHFPFIDTKKTFAEARTDKDRAFYERYCSSLDAQIDALVYELYELTADEIKIVEGKSD